MYAIFENGSHQYRVREGDVLHLDRQHVEPGGTLEFDKVLLISGDGDPILGAPTVAGAKVVAKALQQWRGKKIIIQKFRRRKGYRRRRGHRQYYTTVQISKIVSGR